MKPQHILFFLTFLLAVPIMHWMRQTPTEPPVATNPPTYHEMFRPGYHYSCPTNWMNDPNGLIFANGKYHLYYQFNPHDIVWGDMSWGHATSTDLVHWENLPVAIEMYNDIMIFSGCNIIDVNNTSGLCEKPGCLLAYYTAQSSTEEAQAIAYSNDNGTSYEQYEGNPILAFNLHDFRDPKVIWYEKGQKWIMVVALSAVFKLQLYGSTDLINWTLLSEFGGEGSTAGVWEDPDIFELPIDEQGNTKWVIAHSVAVNCVEYYIGEFDGETFTNTETKGELLFFDYGFDFDESASWNNEPNGRRLMIAYLDDGDYGGALPTQGWRGQLTMIRELKIKRYPEGLRIISQPIPELAILRDNHYNYDNIEINKENSNVTLEFHGAQLEIIAEFVLPKDSNEIPKEFGIKVFTGKNQTTIIGYNTTAGLLFVDRKNSGLVDFCQHFAAISNTTFRIENGTIKFHVFVDHSSVEVFVDDGRIVMTNLIFPDPSQDAVEVYAVGGSVTVSSIDAWTLKDIWSNDTVKAEPKEENSFLTSFDHIRSYISS